MKKPTGAKGPDQIIRSPAADALIAEAFVETFKPECAQRVLTYLRSMTVNAVAGPEVSDAHLRHLEGQRYIVGLISKWVDIGIDQRKGTKDG
jgi:hypothetical protein